MSTKMSGEIFHPPESLDNLDVTKWNPLTCYLCNEKYEEPCILGCFHSFCSRCLRGRNVEGKMTCPLCGSNTQIKEGEDLPPSDRLVKFLVESTGEEKEKCANCDNEYEQMFFCNTCDQPLCGACREETHKAKMFVRHDIVVLSKRTKEIHRECAVHHEPYILFSTERKAMLCINCFRDMKVESRSYCVDLESAYSQGCKKLDQSMSAVKDLQSSVRDAILLLKVLLEEIEQNSDKEKKAVTELYDQLLEKITETKTSLIQEVDRQHDSKEKTFKAELVTLSTILPTLHTHLVTSAAFCSSANRFEFLDLAYVLMERLKTIIQLQHPLHPSEGSQVITDFKSMFAKCLEPLLFPPKVSSVMTTSSAISLTGSSMNLATPSYVTARLDPVIVVSNTSPSQPLQYAQRRQTGYNSIKYKLIESKGIFAEHCAEFDNSHKDLNSGTEKLKTLIQELQRDLTVRRCLAKMTAVSELEVQIKTLQKLLDEHFSKNEQKQILLEKHWEESLKRIATEQELYQAQIHDIIRLKQESEQLQTILTRMSSFVASIASVTERIAPKLGQTTKDHENDTKIAQIFEQINTMTPDSNHRVNAIRTAQEERETLTANRTNPLDQELIKTKGLLRAPSARKDVGRRDSTKRNSKEITDDKEMKASPIKGDHEVSSPKKIEIGQFSPKKIENGVFSPLKVDVNNLLEKVENDTSPKKSEDGLLLKKYEKERTPKKADNKLQNLTLAECQDTKVSEKEHEGSVRSKLKAIIDDNETDNDLITIDDHAVKDTRRSPELDSINSKVDTELKTVSPKEQKLVNHDQKSGTDSSSKSSSKFVNRNEKGNSDPSSKSLSELVNYDDSSSKPLSKLMNHGRKSDTDSSLKSLSSNEHKTVKQEPKGVVKVDSSFENSKLEAKCQNLEKVENIEYLKENDKNKKENPDTLDDKSSEEKESFSLPKDFVATTVKGFETQTSPTKDDKITKRTRRTRRSKQSQVDVESSNQSCD